MKRNIVNETIILKNSPFGEIHRNVTMFTRDFGLLHATAYGALKSTGKLRSSTSAFTFGTVYLYNEPVKGSYKITDMDVGSYFEGIRENLQKFFSASLWAEMVLVSYGGGESSPELFGFLLDALSYLDELEDEREISYCLIQFIWRYLHLQGVQPETDYCAGCGRSTGEKEMVYYTGREEGFVCERCAGGTALSFGAGTRRYLAHTSLLPFRHATRIRLSREATTALKLLMFRLAESSVERELNTVRTGEGIL